jgi:hypothetical protein
MLQVVERLSLRQQLQAVLIPMTRVHPLHMISAHSMAALMLGPLTRFSFS